MTDADNPRTALTNVRVFDGRGLSAPTTVVIDGAVIGTDATGAQVLDAAGAVLLPGLIDAHVHLQGPESLDLLAAHGVTTTLDMTTFPKSLLDPLRKVPGTTDIRSAGTPVIGAGGMHAQIPGLAEVAVIDDPEQAESMVRERFAAGSDYLKLVLEAPGEGGPDEAAAKAVVGVAHSLGMRVVAHAASVGAYEMGLNVGVDIFTHIPLAEPLPAQDVDRMAAGRHATIPTLTMMEGIAHILGRDEGFAASLASVGALHAAGVPILAGTDANAAPNVPFQPPHGASLHHELELLVRAGLSPVEALNGATTTPLDSFGLDDRGVIAPGKRADLLLIEGDPTVDIRATRNITRIWCGGVEHACAEPVDG